MRGSVVCRGAHRKQLRGKQLRGKQLRGKQLRGKQLRGKQLRGRMFAVWLRRISGLVAPHHARLLDCARSDWRN